MLINLRNALMTGKRLPYDAEVEFLESTGTQWIDTGIVGDNTATFKGLIYRTSTTTNECAVGSLGASFTRGWLSYFFSNKYYLGYGSRVDSPTTAPSDEWLYQELKHESGNANLYANGVVVASVPITTFTTGQNIYIGAMNSEGSASYHFIGKFAGIQIYKSGILVRDYIPVRKGAVGYLYDRVSGKLFGNAGTGDFVLGPDVVPVEWLGSYGYQYIDTGTIPDDTTGIEVVHTICPNNGIDNIIFGARQDSGNTRYWCDIDWGGGGTIGWGFNTYSGSSDRFALASSDVGRVITNSLNYMNDRAGKIDGVTYDSSLQSKTLSTMNRSIYLFGANNQGVVGLRGTFKVYSAKISKGQTLVNKFRPVRVGTDATSWEGAMMEVLTRRIYRNAGTGAFTYGNDRRYPIPAS